MFICTNIDSNVDVNRSYNTTVKSWILVYYYCLFLTCQILSSCQGTLPAGERKYATRCWRCCLALTVLFPLCLYPRLGRFALSLQAPGMKSCPAVSWSAALLLGIGSLILIRLWRMQQANTIEVTLFGDCGIVVRRQRNLQHVQVFCRFALIINIVLCDTIII